MSNLKVFNQTIMDPRTQAYIADQARAEAEAKRNKVSEAMNQATQGAQ